MQWPSSGSRNWEIGTARRVPPARFLELPLRAHRLLNDIPLYDVTVVDLPGGGPGRTLQDIKTLDRAAPPSTVVKTLFQLRRWLGRVFHWDHPLSPEDTLLPQLSERDRRDSLVPPGTADGHFLVLYEFPTESVRETRNATVRGWVSTALVPIVDGYRLYFAVYVLPVSWITRP
jgi:hypothetical protein